MICEGQRLLHRLTQQPHPALGCRNRNDHGMDEADGTFEWDGLRRDRQSVAAFYFRDSHSTWSGPELKASGQEIAPVRIRRCKYPAPGPTFHPTSFGRPPSRIALSSSQSAEPEGSENWSCCCALNAATSGKLRSAIEGVWINLSIV